MSFHTAEYFSSGTGVISKKPIPSWVEAKLLIFFPLLSVTVPRTAKGIPDWLLVLNARRQEIFSIRSPPSGKRVKVNLSFGPVVFGGGFALMTVIGCRYKGAGSKLSIHEE